MRILFFAQAFLPIVGGAERFLDQLARRMLERGHDVTVLAARVRGAPEIEVPYRLRRYRKPFSKRFLPRHTVAHLLHEHAHGRPDVVHAHGAYPPGYSVALYARWTGLPWAVRPLGGDVLAGEGVRKNPKLEARVGETLRAATRVVAQSAELEEIALSFGVDRARIVRIPNAVDAADLGSARFARSREPLVAAMGIFFRKKGFDVLLEAFRAVRARHPRARLVLAGDGRERAALEAQARKNGLDGAVSFPGMLDGEAKARLLAEAWVFVSSARREPFSNANLEALAAGLPMVATEVGGNREIVANGDNGCLVPAEDAAAMASAISELLADDACRASMGRRSRAIADRYSWSSIGDRYEALYRELCAERGRALPSGASR